MALGRAVAATVHRGDRATNHGLSTARRRQAQPDPQWKSRAHRRLTRAAGRARDPQDQPRQIVKINGALGGVLGITALSASRSRDSYLAARYRRLAGRRGKLRAVVAVEHSILTAAWYMLTNNVDYHDLGEEHYIRRDPERALRRITKQANTLGNTIRFDPIPTPNESS